MKRILGLLAFLTLFGVTSAQAQDTVRVVGIGRSDTTCFVTGTVVSAARCAAPTDTVVTPPDTVVTPPSGEFAHSYNKWAPSRPDECTAEQHNAYRVQVDGKWYPTWHPPVHPSGCFFGHEHGKDPTGSEAGAEDLAFGYANEALAVFEGQMPRHEDHVGHKVEWANDVIFSGTGATRTCDVLIKLHQGTHSADAFTNNVHEFLYHLKCDDGAEMHFAMMAPIGPGGSFLQTCTGTTIKIDVGAPNPIDSPGGVDSRQIPTRACVDRYISGDRRSQGVQYVKGLGETWPVSVTLTRESGSRIALVAIYAKVGYPSRFYDPAMPGNLGKSIGICYETDDPNDGRTMNECRTARSFLPDTLTQYDPRSPFNGASRSVRWNQIQLLNANQPTVYYTDPFGKNGRLVPFPGSIRQVFTAMNNDGLRVAGQGSFGRDYTAPGVRAPN